MEQLPYTGERAIPWNSQTGARILHHHVMRYAWALDKVWNKETVDLGSGAGYGAYMLSWAAKTVRGIDIDENSIAYSAAHFSAPNLAYTIGDISDLEQLPPAEIYTAFEVLEHLADPQRLLDHLPAPLVWSIPIANPNPPHTRAYTRAQIEQLMEGSEFRYQLASGLIVAQIPTGAPVEYVLGRRP